MSKTKHFIGHDFGTSGVKSIIIDEAGVIKAEAIETYPMQTPQSGWVEQKPKDYWNAITTVTKRLLESSKIDKSTVSGIAFSPQSQGVIPIDKDGNVLHPNITWVDGRAEEEAVKLMKKFLGRKIFKTIVGIEITGKDVLPKLLWLKDKRPDIYNATDKFLDVGGFLKFKCTGKKVAEWSGACSYAFNLKKKDWERIFFKIAGVDLNKLPDLVKSTDLVGGLTKEAANAMGLDEGTAVYGGCDDSQSAALGSGSVHEENALIYLGTAAQVGVATKREIKFKNGAVCLQSADPAKNIVLGVTEASGVNIEWILNSFYQHEKKELSPSALFDLLESEISSVPPGSDHLIFTPWFLGERCPVATTTTRSTLFNLSHEHTRGHMSRAHCEGIAFNVRWTIENMEKDFGFKINQLRCIGGGSENDAWMQVLADVTKKKILRTNQPRMAGAIGSAMCAMVGSGVKSNFEAIDEIIHVTQTFEPNPEHNKIYQTNFDLYKQLYSALKQTYINANKERFSIEQ